MLGRNKTPGLSAADSRYQTHDGTLGVGGVKSGKTMTRDTNHFRPFLFACYAMGFVAMVTIVVSGLPG